MFALILLLCYASSNAQLLSQGDECTVYGTNIRGTCIKANRCARNPLRTGINPQFCGVAGNKPLVCCPKNLSLPYLCFEYTAHGQIYGVELGTKALSKEFPHMAAIGYGDSVTSLIGICGGSLISPDFVMTAAHCTYSREFGPAKYVRLGDLDLKSTTEDASPRDIAIADIHVHPQYRSSSKYHDIALLQLAERVFFGLYLKPACLHTQHDLPVSTLEAIGWGKLGFLGDRSSHLMKVNLNIVDHQTCARRYANFPPRNLKNGILDQIQLCAGDSVGSDTCPGDSGGPLHYLKNGTDFGRGYFVVAGITSFGKGCGGENSVGVYTRVSAYVDWIESIVSPEITQQDRSNQPSFPVAQIASNYKF